MLPDTEAEVVEADAVPAKDADADIQIPNGKDAEAQAQKHGWRPKDQWEGEPDKWISAEEFLRRGEENPRILRDRLRKMEKSNEETLQLMRDLMSGYRKDKERAVSDAVAKFKAERREAIKEGDVERAEALDGHIEQLQEQAKPAKEKPEIAQIPSEYSAWAKANPWFYTDAAMSVAARAELDIINADEDTASLADAEKLKLVNKAMRARYPHKFQQAKRPSAPSVEGGSSAPRGEGKKGWNDLPPDIRQIAERLVAKGATTKEKYLKEYAW